MNFRVILLVLIVFIFTLVCIIASNMYFESTSLKDTYNQGDVEITQNTAAGTIPHVVLVKNNGKKPIMVETGQILESNSSQDLVIAEYKKVNQNSSSYIMAYCFEPNQTAIPGAKLKPTDKASSDIQKIIKNTNLSDSQNTSQTQLQIWIMVSKNNLNINSGEAALFIEKQGNNTDEILKKVQNAKNNLIKSLNITEGDLKNLNTSSKISFNGILNLINEFINWIKYSFNIN
ncbi:MAG: hypothetical protein LLF83_05640 [Methanobacterium sp.]|nr:hypothetical protein [Methanobacterium sp.]